MVKTMVIVPHGDDEILGFYGAIKRNLEQNNHVSVAFIMGPKNLTNERNTHQFHTIEKVKDKLGYNEVFYLDIFNEHNIHSNKLELITRIEELVSNNHIDIVYTTHWGDNHQTHKLCYEAVVAAIRPIGPCKASRLITGEIISSTDQAPQTEAHSFIPNIFLELSEQEIEEKINLLKMYEYEYMQTPHPRSEWGLKAVASFRGIQAGVKYAEGYFCAREIIKK